MSVLSRTPTHADLVAAAKERVSPDKALLARAAAGREAIDCGADPELTLALVVWPSDELLAALEHAGTVKGSGVRGGAQPVLTLTHVSRDAGVTGCGQVIAALPESARGRTLPVAE